MARRRLQTILATTVLAAGLSVAPASAQTLSDLTDGVEETTDAVEDTVDKTTDTVDDTVEKTTKAVEDATTGSSGSDDSDDSDDSGDSNDDSSSDDGGGGDLGSTVEDTTKTVTDTVDETVEETTRVVEDTTKTVTDAVDSTPPDDADSDGEAGDDGGKDTSGTQPVGGLDDRGFAPGDEVIAAGSDDSRTAQDPNATSSGGSLAEALAAFGALGRSGSSNTTLTGQDTTSSTDLPAPQVADPDTEPFDEFAGSSDVEKPAVMASGPADPTDSSAALLKVFAALLVLGTGVTAKRAVEQA